MKRKAGVLLILLGVTLLLSAAALTSYNIWDEKRAGDSSEEVLIQLVQRIPSLPPARETTPDTPANEVVYPDYVLNPNMDMPQQEVDGYGYIGVLSIPSVGLELPVINEWSEAGAKLAPCRYSGSAYLDDLVIAAHNYAPHFGALPDVRLGDDVIFTDVDGNEFQYSVVEFEVLQPVQIEEMITGDWDLSLFTCTVGGQTRLALRCEIME